MFQRRKMAELIDKFAIPRTTIAVVSDTSSPQVSVYLNGGKVSSLAETRIDQAVRDIAALMERFGDVRIDLAEPVLVKLLIGKMADMAFSILVTVNPTAWFVSRSADGAIDTTPYFLGATGLSLGVANEVADEIGAAAVVDQPYRLNQPVHNPLADVRQSEEFRKAMGLQ